MKPSNLPPLPEPVIIPGVMQTLREIRDKNSLQHMNMTPRELLEEAALFRSMQEKTPDKLSVMS